MGPPSTVAGSDRERQLDGLDDAVEEQMPLGRLELFRVLLGLGQGAQVVLELLAHGAETAATRVRSRMTSRLLRTWARGLSPRPRSSCPARERARL